MQVNFLDMDHFVQLLGKTDKKVDQQAFIMRSYQSTMDSLSMFSLDMMLELFADLTLDNPIPGSHSWIGFNRVNTIIGHDQVKGDQKLILLGLCGNLLNWQMQALEYIQESGKWDFDVCHKHIDRRILPFFEKLTNDESIMVALNENESFPFDIQTYVEGFYKLLKSGEELIGINGLEETVIDRIQSQSSEKWVSTLEPNQIMCNHKLEDSTGAFTKTDRSPLMKQCQKCNAFAFDTVAPAPKFFKSQILCTHPINAMLPMEGTNLKQCSICGTKDLRRVSENVGAEQQTYLQD